MLKRVFTLFMTVMTLSLVLSSFAGIQAGAVTSDVATISFDTDAAISNFYSDDQIDPVLSITDEYGYTGRCLKVSLTIPDNKAHSARILFDAGKLKLSNLNNCTIEAHILFPDKADKVWGPGTQSVSLIATDPSWIEARTDSSLYGAWQTVSLQCGPNDNNKSFGFYFPVATGNAGEVVCYIDDIRIVKDDVVVDSIDMDSAYTYPMPTDSATFATVAEPEIDTTPVEDSEPAETKPVVVPTGDPNSKSSLIIILVVTFVMVAAIAGIIYFFIWKSKNKYY